MGLDQYAYTVSQRGLKLWAKSKEIPNIQERHDYLNACDYEDEVEEFHYWRKHADLNEWMTQLALWKGVVHSPNEFNCVDLFLDAKDIDNLERAITQGLPHGEGFFWGSSNDKDAELDKEFIVKARKEIAEGKQIVYRCWW